MLTLKTSRDAWESKKDRIIEKVESKHMFVHFYGRVKIFLDDKEIITEPHACICYEKNTTMHYQFLEQSFHDWLSFDGDLDELLGKCMLQKETIYYPKDYQTIIDIIRNLSAYEMKYDSISMTLADAKITEVFAYLAYNIYYSKDDMNLPRNLTTPIYLLRQSIINNPAAKIDVKTAASMLNMGKTRFSQVYKQFNKRTFVEDIIYIKIEKAKALLTQGHLVSEVAEILGYNDVYYFIHQFKKSTGKTPKQFVLKKWYKKISAKSTFCKKAAGGNNRNF